MSKRASGKFERNARDFYKTPYEGIVPLLPHLPTNISFCEPCAGDGRLIDHLEINGLKCRAAWDIEPLRSDIDKQDARTTENGSVDYFITNPPWNRDDLHQIIYNLSRQKPTWLLFDADWMHTVQSTPYMEKCRKIVSVGRLKWFDDSKSVGYDNCCWYLFEPCSKHQYPTFIGR